MPRTRFMNRKDDASEVASELSSELSSYERGDADILEEEVLEDENDFFNNEDEGIFESTPSKNRRGARGSAEKVNFNEALILF